MNGECRCRKGTSGNYCQYKETDGPTFGLVFFYFIMFLVSVVLILGLFYGAFYLIKKIVSKPLY